MIFAVSIRLFVLFTLRITYSLQQSSVWLNAALFKPAYQSTTYVPYLAAYGNDGNRKFFSNPRSCQQTYRNNPAWWMVDLRGTFVIEQIVLTNRADQWSVRLKDFQIEVFDTDPRDIPAFPNVTGKVCLNMSTAVSNGTFTWNCTKPLIGRYVWTIMRHLEYLHVAEYEIMVSEIIDKVSSSYKKKTGQKIVNVPALRNHTGIRSSLQCAAHCSSLRVTETCTAFNWFYSTQECQLFKLDARDETSFQLKNATDADCFTET